MGFHGMNLSALILIFFIVVLFGAKQLREIGGNLSATLRSFHSKLQKKQETEE